jgi:ankyrin repeat protein
MTLIERGADINHADDENRTPLHLAIMENRLPLVKYLLHNNANIYVRFEK